MGPPQSSVANRALWSWVEDRNRGATNSETLSGEHRPDSCLPDFSDYNHLPYMRAFVKELVQCHIVAPLRLPQTTMEGDEYNGYFIPAHTIIHANIWYVWLLRTYSPVIGGSWFMAHAGLCPRIPTQMLSNRSASSETSLSETLRTMYLALEEGNRLPVLHAQPCHPLPSIACPGRHFAAARCVSSRCPR